MWPEMGAWASVALTLAVGALGGWLAQRLRVPGGAILGALATAAALHLTVPGLSPVPEAVRVIAQILVGTAVGASVCRGPLRAMRRVTAAALPLLFVLLCVAILSGFAFAHLSDLSLLTTVFSTAPGGASDMTAAALEFDTDVSLIAGFHLIRQVAIFGILTWLFSRLLGRPRQ